MEKKQDLFTTKEVAKRSGVHRDTLLRWLRQGKIREPARNRNGWRVFTTDEVDDIVSFAMRKEDAVSVKESRTVYSSTSKINTLKDADWNFKNYNTSFLTHSLHPFPAKFIPQIPKTLIRELSSTGDTVLDPFCGSGTTLVEALRLECNAIGIDANPLSCMISKAKTFTLDEDEASQLYELADTINKYADERLTGALPLFPEDENEKFNKKNKVNHKIKKWFYKHVIEELSLIKELCFRLDKKKLQTIALTALSSIIVKVSKQDSDTRYVRRDKNISRGETLKHFNNSLIKSIDRIREFSKEVNPNFVAKVIEANILQPPEIKKVDLIVCSPPYPNAYSYHLYHQHRMLWLDMDQPKFKAEEIGSHRKYSRKGKNAATVDTFRGELYTILSWITNTLHNNKFACFVIGDSTIKGEVIRNNEILIEIAKSLGFKIEANIIRKMDSTKKYFNPKNGSIKKEHIVILRNTSF